MKFLLLCLAILLCCSGCQDDTEQQKSNELIMWESFNAQEHEVLLKIIAKFTEQYEKKNGDKGANYGSPRTI